MSPVYTDHLKVWSSAPSPSGSWASGIEALELNPAGLPPVTQRSGQRTLLPNSSHASEAPSPALLQTQAARPNSRNWLHTPSSALAFPCWVTSKLFRQTLRRKPSAHEEFTMWKTLGSPDNSHLVYSHCRSLLSYCMRSNRSTNVICPESESGYFLPCRGWRSLQIVNVMLKGEDR